MGDREKAIEEIHFGKEHGACGVFVRAFEGEQRISDPYFFPLYTEAQALNLPICIHASTGNFNYFDLFFTDSGFSTFKLSVVGTFHDLLLKQVPAKFPDLRWAFIEVSAQWLPYVMKDLSLRFAKQGQPFLSKAALKENRMYVACQTSDDLDLILERVGDENIIIGTDYGHNDTASELHALRKLRQSGMIDAATANKILWENPKRLYGL
jgi:predicted TIM-barrel fold metal-dependent hydrolase